MLSAIHSTEIYTADTRRGPILNLTTGESGEDLARCTARLREPALDQVHTTDGGIRTCPAARS